MLYGPQEYPKLSSVAIKFINSISKVEPKKAYPEYKYLGVGANLSQAATQKESKVHKYLSPSAITENVKEEFGQLLNVSV